MSNLNSEVGLNCELNFSFYLQPITTKNLFEIVNKDELRVKTTVADGTFDYEGTVNKYQIILKLVIYSYILCMMKCCDNIVHISNKAL